MNTRKMGVVTLLMMFVIIGVALSGGSQPSKQDAGMVSGAVVGGVGGSAVSDGSTGRQLDRR